MNTRSTLRHAAPRALALATVLGVVLLSAAPAPAQGPTTERARQAGLFTLYVENDYFTGTDRNYTNGVKLSWMTADLSDWGQRGWRQHLLESLPFINATGTQKNLGFSLGQNIYTPKDSTRRVPDPMDRPYAGWTYLEGSFVSKSSTRADIVSVQVGLFGPSSLAEQTQKTFHRVIDDDLPQGWDHQLRDEVGVNLIYEQRRRLVTRAFSDRVGFDVIPHGGVCLGTVQSYVNLGATLRMGLNLPSDFGVSLARGGAIGASPVNDLDPRVALNRDVSLFLFAAADGRAVARDATLDGNLWKDSPSVDRKVFVADLSSGVGLIVGRWQLTGSYVYRTREFDTQPDPHSQFGSVTLSAAF